MHAPRALRRRSRRPRMAVVTTSTPPALDLRAAIDDHLDLQRRRWRHDIAERTAALEARGPAVTA